MNYCYSVALFIEGVFVMDNQKFFEDRKDI